MHMNEVVLNLDMKELDATKSAKKAMRALRKYRMYMLSVDDEYLPKITPTYSLTPPSCTNQFHSSTENVIDVIDREREKQQYMTLIWKGINRLSAESRKLIVEKFMGRDELYDFEVYNSMGISKPNFDRKKRKALVDLACALKIEEYVAIGKTLKLSPSFPPLNTVRATFTAHGVPSYPFILKQLDYKLYGVCLFSSIVYHSIEVFSYIF